MALGVFHPTQSADDDTRPYPVQHRREQSRTVVAT